MKNKKKHYYFTFKNILEIISLHILIWSLIISLMLTGCAYKKVYKDVYSWEDVPYTDYEYQEKTRKVPNKVQYEVDEYKLVEPYFPYTKNKNIKIAVLPFTDSDYENRGGIGIRVASEIEFALIKRIEKWQKKSEREIKNSMYRLIENEHIGGITKLDIDNWYKNNKRPMYEVVDRTELQMMLSEANITSENYMNKLRKDITAVDGLIIGNATMLDNYSTSFILKVVDVKTSKIIFTEKYQGEFDECINNAVDAFFYNIKSTGQKVTKYKTEYVKENYQAKVPVTKTKKEKVKKKKWVEEVDAGMTLVYWGIGILVIILALTTKKETKGSSSY